MTGPRMIELSTAAVILGLGIWLYGRRARHSTGPDSSYGSQSAVILLVIAVIIGIHALGGLDYHPSQSEVEAIKGAAR
jgi:hypothetical protein